MTRLRIEEQMIGSYYVFTSPDVPGLYVAHPDRETALRDIQPTIDAMDRVRNRVAARAVVEHRAASFA